MQSPLRFLAIGASLTAGFCEYGLTNHPYSIRLSELFYSANIPVVIDQRGVSSERVVPTMVKRLETLLINENNPHYDWVLILGGTNDLGYRTSAEIIFNEGLKIMYDMVLERTNGKTKLAAMTLLETGYYPPGDSHDRERQKLNEMIRNYVSNCQDQNRLCLVDLDKGIPYHGTEDVKTLWDDLIHLTPDGYDRMASIIFQEIYRKINQT
jgi:lysophospholipase L1-like esterase